MPNQAKTAAPTNKLALDETEVVLAKHIEAVYLEHASVNRQNFLNSLKFLIKKYS